MPFLDNHGQTLHDKTMLAWSESDSRVNTISRGSIMPQSVGSEDAETGLQMDMEEVPLTTRIQWTIRDQARAGEARCPRIREVPERWQVFAECQVPMSTKDGYVQLVAVDHPLGCSCIVGKIE
eukprot:g45774.t1